MGESIPVDGSVALLGYHSRSGILKVDARFIGSHARFCRSIRFLEIAKTLDSTVPPQSSTWHIASQPRPVSRKALAFWGLVSSAVLAIWLVLPRNIRMATYEAMRKFGRLLYGPPDDYSTAQRLPFGLYLEYRGEPDLFYNEGNAL